MSGHSKWANIRFRKAAQDAKRGKIFTKLIREITTAARMGGGDESSNPRLRSAVVAALAQNMTRDTIKRAIDRGVGGGEGADLENITYEGYGVGGVAVMVECMTDNHNRTASDVRHAFTKFGGNLGTSGSVGYLFTRKGVISFAPDEDGKMNIDEEKAMEIGLEAGADDIVTNDDGSIDVYTTPEAFADVVEAFEKNNIKPVNAEVSMVPSTESELEGDQAVKCMRMIDALEDLDDVQNVYHNASFPDDLEI
ncbi:MAG: YebC/PmpR family DNA-binding transcriptional regulator [Succinivibrio sp.]|jgi:YebC/PmpR family DNA-binding regulatory protein|uniref:YebC/PmpR family DNA-binding transcriptional regulator n=1 Tax=Succinivibrio sp. TaxID=2053619 RepID=UPI000EE157B6|nr:YebC/PmpR family DNA-binding transcriptional regulator [Succinivibrio sp.]MBQ8477944.1 YebC/PmpR family DNA-binding transcriptional regulator [Succinivibrio sp.]MCI5577011.1 YebC/PmpR family DNA-binding transcriptional regulator [Succinivibrio sp.]MCI5638804.1 YebC/PmpR family DNA-binding transcriptional regulator [Succinivibrio sp.]MCI6449186.1 YebC/PmpR family DNA-binding transcriptional regulator [Succinivibrio sp.]